MCNCFSCNYEFDYISKSINSINVTFLRHHLKMTDVLKLYFQRKTLCVY